MKFTLRVAFILLTVIAIFLVIQFTLPDSWIIRVNVGLWHIAPLLIAPLIVYGKGNLRAFAIGATAPHAIMLTTIIVHGTGTPPLLQTIHHFVLGNQPVFFGEQGSDFRDISLLLWGSSIALGVLWLAIRQFLLRIEKEE